MTKAMNQFKKLNGIFPQRIIFYRDGVGEGQMSGICAPEIESIKSCFVNLGIPETQLMYLNVNKRINTRLFGGDIGAFKNPMPGTVIDQSITDKDIYEFFLIATAAK